MMSDLVQIWYQNPDTSLAYVLEDAEGNQVGYGGEIAAGAVPLADDEALVAAQDELAATQDAALVAAQAAAEEAEAARAAAAEEQAALARAAADKLIALGLTTEEAIAIIGYGPQVGEPLAPEE